LWNFGQRRDCLLLVRELHRVSSGRVCLLRAISAKFDPATK
jgi:hypothetical protein